MVRQLVLLSLAVFRWSTANQLGAQSAATARQLPAPEAVSQERFGDIQGVHAFPDGRLVVHERARRRVVLLDPSLQASRVLLDSTRATDNGYPGPAGGLVSWRGDSALFVEPMTLTMTLIGPTGHVVGTRAVPRSSDAALIAGALTPTVADRTGRLIYRGAPIPGAPTISLGPRGAAYRPSLLSAFARGQADSAWLLRIDVHSRQLDTLTSVRVPALNITVATAAESEYRVDMVVNPFPIVDGWGVLSNGDIVIVRGRDYRLEWIRHGARTVEAGVRIPFRWRRLTVSEKATLIDSVRAMRRRAHGADSLNVGGSDGPVVFMRSGGRVGDADMRGEGAGRRISPLSPVRTIEASEMPDYLPPFGANAVLIDPHDRIWIRLSLPTPEGYGPLYDVLTPMGVRLTSVLLPARRAVAGFGPNDAVYLTSTEPDGLQRLERTSWR